MRKISLIFLLFIVFSLNAQDDLFLSDTPKEDTLEREIPPQVFLSYTVENDELTVKMDREDPMQPGLGCSGSRTHLFLRLPFNRFDTLQILNDEQITIDYSYSGGRLFLSSQRASSMNLELEKMEDTLFLTGFIRLILSDNSVGSQTKDIQLDLKFIAKHDVRKNHYLFNVSQEAFIEEEPIVQVPELEAEFPGGPDAMMKFLIENIRYPQDAKEWSIEGRVFISLVVERDGTLSNIEIVRGVLASLDQEAIRVVRQMPKWIPAQVKGEKVRTKVYIPITFKMK